MNANLLNLVGAVTILVAGLGVLVLLVLVIARSLRARDDQATRLAEFARIQADKIGRAHV